MSWKGRAIHALAAGVSSFAIVFGLAALSDPLPPDTTYRPLPARPLSAVRADDGKDAAEFDHVTFVLDELEYAYAVKADKEKKRAAGVGSTRAELVLLRQ
jgi:hypothetical protein